MRRAATDEGWSARHLLPVRSIPSAGREFTLLRESQVWYSTRLLFDSCGIRIDPHVIRPGDLDPALADPDPMPDLPIQALN
jgi:hypothetical protein